MNIAMLRLWLSLAIEYEGEKPEPLPNLDFKIVCEDSLLGPDPSPESVPTCSAMRWPRMCLQMQRLGDLKAQYMSANDGNAKQRLKQLRSPSSKAAGAASAWATLPMRSPWTGASEFAEVFAGGITRLRHRDRQSAVHPACRRTKASWPIATGVVGYKVPSSRTGDVYQLLLRARMPATAPRVAGMMAYITSNSWLKAEVRRSRQRRYFAERHTPLCCLLDLGKDTFESRHRGHLRPHAPRRAAAAQTFAAVDMDRFEVRQDIPPPAGELWGRTSPDQRRHAPWSILSRYGTRASWTRCRPRAHVTRRIGTSRSTLVSRPATTPPLSLTMRHQDVLVSEDPEIRGHHLSRAAWEGHTALPSKVGRTDG